MSYIDATSEYPNNYILMRMDDFESDMGEVLYIGDDESELYELMDTFDNRNHCGIIEGVNISLNCLGGVVAIDTN